MTEQQAEQESRSDRDTWSGRTYPEHSVATRAKTFRQSSKKSSASQTKNPMYLSLRRENGRQPDASWATISPSLGECLMPNTGECPKEESVSTLSQILEETPHQKYYLSEKACLGILRRAEKRGKELPEILRLALISPTLTTKMGTGGNNVPIVLENHPQDSRVTIAEDGNVPTLTSRMGTGGGNVPMIMNEVRAVDQRNLSLGNDKSETLHGSGHGSSVGTIIEPMALHITQDPTVFEGKTPCLTQGNPKTGQATVGVAIPIADKATRYKGGGSTRNNDGSANGLGIGEPGAPANTLTAADRHAVAYAIDRAAFNQGMNAQYDISVQEETTQTLVARGPGGGMSQDADGEERSNDDGEYG